MASKLDIAREYIMRNYNEGADFRWDVLSRKLQIRKADCANLAPMAKEREHSSLRSGQSPKDKDGVVWQDVDTRLINSIACDCAQETQVNINDKEIRLVLNSEAIRAVHPLRDWLKEQEPYNPTEHGGISMIDWLSSQVKVKENLALAAKDEFSNLAPEANIERERWRKSFKKWFVAMVACWMYDEVVNQQVLVLIGKQGIYKTTWLEHLLPPCLRAYQTKMSTSDELNKDERMRIGEFGLIHLEEIDALDRRGLNKMKSLVTSSDINERAAYGYTKERRVRVASFCGSGNEGHILTDMTGNRRWLMFEVENIDNPFLFGDESVYPYSQIYGEAKYLISRHFNYWFDMEDIEEIEENNARFMELKNEEDLLPVYFSPANPGDNGAVFLTTAEISQRLHDWGSIPKPMALNVLGRVIQRMGYLPRKSNGKQGYVVYVNQDLDSQRKLDARSATDGTG